MCAGGGGVDGDDREPQGPDGWNDWFNAGQPLWLPRGSRKLTNQLVYTNDIGGLA